MLARRVIWRLYRTWVEADLRFRRYFLGMGHVTDRVPYSDSRLLPHLLRRLGAQIGADTVLMSPVHISPRGLTDYRSLRIGDKCHIGENVLLDLSGDLVLGNRVTISMGSSIITHLDVGWSQLIQTFERRMGQVRIEDDCYLGANVLVLPNVHIGELCFIGAGAVVTKDIPERSLAVGVPARVIRRLEIEG